MERGGSNIPPTNYSPIDDAISILVVDDDITCLAIVAAILKKLKYEGKPSIYVCVCMYINL